MITNNNQFIISCSICEFET